MIESAVDQASRKDLIVCRKAISAACCTQFDHTALQMRRAGDIETIGATGGIDIDIIDGPRLKGCIAADSHRRDAGSRREHPASANQQTARHTGTAQQTAIEDVHGAGNRAVVCEFASCDGGLTGDGPCVGEAPGGVGERCDRAVIRRRSFIRDSIHCRTEVADEAATCSILNIAESVVIDHGTATDRRRPSHRSTCIVGEEPGLIVE